MNVSTGITAKTLALLILLAILSPLFFWFWWLANYAAERRLRIDDTLLQYDRFRSIAAFDISKSGHSLENSRPLVFLADGPQSVQTSALQSRIREMAAQRGVDILQASELKPIVAAPGLQKLGIHVEMSGPVAGLHAVLQQIEISVPWLFVDNLQLRAGYADPSQGEPPLTLSADILGVVPVAMETPNP
jgi:Type II secretion system (T2SS), protein M subtype b